MARHPVITRKQCDQGTVDGGSAPAPPGQPCRDFLHAAKRTRRLGHASEVGPNGSLSLPVAVRQVLKEVAEIIERRSGGHMVSISVPAAHSMRRADVAIGLA